MKSRALFVLAACAVLGRAAVARAEEAPAPPPPAPRKVDSDRVWGVGVSIDILLGATYFWNLPAAHVTAPGEASVSVPSGRSSFWWDALGARVTYGPKQGAYLVLTGLRGSMTFDGAVSTYLAGRAASSSSAGLAGALELGGAGARMFLDRSDRNDDNGSIGVAIVPTLVGTVAGAHLATNSGPTSSEALVTSAFFAVRAELEACSGTIATEASGARGFTGACFLVAPIPITYGSGKLAISPGLGLAFRASFW